jgi:predicted small integral membrane protein
MNRLLKFSLIVFVSLFCLMYAAQNLVNLGPAYSFVNSVISMADHTAYPTSFGPALSGSFLTWLILAIIIVLEILAGLLAGKGAMDMWNARHESAAEFNAAKKYGVIGCGVALVIWFGLFSTIGGAYFQMWQTPLGNAALTGAFQYAMLNGLVLLVVNQADE